MPLPALDVKELKLDAQRVLISIQLILRKYFNTHSILGVRITLWKMYLFYILNFSGVNYSVV